MDAESVMETPARRTNLQAARAATASLWSACLALAAAMATGDRSAFNPRSVGQKFLQDIGAEANPIKEVALGFIMIGIALVIALTVLPVITSAVETAAGDGNISASDATLLRLLPTLLIVGLMAGGVAFLFRGFKSIKG